MLPLLVHETGDGDGDHCIDGDGEWCRVTIMRVATKEAQNLT